MHGDAVTQFVAYFANGGTRPGVWTHLGIALDSSRPHRRSDSGVSTRHRADPRAPDPHRNLAAVLMERETWPPRSPTRERAVALNPGDAASRDLLGVALATQGRKDEAVRHFREALRLDP